MRQRHTLHGAAAGGPSSRHRHQLHGGDAMRRRARHARAARLCSVSGVAPSSPCSSPCWRRSGSPTAAWAYFTSCRLGCGIRVGGHGESRPHNDQPHLDPRSSRAQAASYTVTAVDNFNGQTTVTSSPNPSLSITHGSLHGQLLHLDDRRCSDGDGHILWEDGNRYPNGQCRFDEHERGFLYWRLIGGGPVRHLHRHRLGELRLARARPAVTWSSTTAASATRSVAAPPRRSTPVHPIPPPARSPTARPAPTPSRRSTSAPLTIRPRPCPRASPRRSPPPRRALA